MEVERDATQHAAVGGWLGDPCSGPSRVRWGQQPAERVANDRDPDASRTNLSTVARPDPERVPDAAHPHLVDADHVHHDRDVDAHADLDRDFDADLDANLDCHEDPDAHDHRDVVARHVTCRGVVQPGGDRTLRDAAVAVAAPLADRRRRTFSGCANRSHSVSSPPMPCSR